MSGITSSALIPDVSAQQHSTSDAVLTSHVSISHSTTPHQNPEDNSLHTRSAGVASQCELSTAVPSSNDRTLASEDHKDVAQVCQRGSCGCQ